MKKSKLEELLFKEGLVDIAAGLGDYRDLDVDIHLWLRNTPKIIYLEFLGGNKIKYTVYQDWRREK